MIRAAFTACGGDNDLSDARRYLSLALQHVQKAGKARVRRANNVAAESKRRTEQDKWWDMIKKNAANNIEPENLTPEVSDES